MVLLVVDTQKLIMTEKLYNFTVVKDSIGKLIAKARENDVEVIYVCHDDGEGTNLTPGTTGFEIYEGFAKQPNEKMFIKRYNSAFKDTELSKYLKSKQENDLFICGLQTDLCIDATIKSGFEQGYNITVVKDCNTTEDNQYLDGKTTVEYFNHFIWNERYANVIDFELVDDLIKASHLKLEETKRWQQAEKVRLLNNTAMITTTVRGKERIQKNLGISSKVDVVKYCIEQIEQADIIERRGKNWYIESNNYLITVNARSFTIITAKVIGKR